MLKTYFRSGWAFFIPYLAAYLLYAWLRWPVNPVDGGQWTVVPCLLHVYWLLHAVHLVLGAFALRAWWRAGGKGQGAKSEEQLVQPTSSLLSSESVGLPAANRLLSTGYRLLPWLCLALLFWIPGVYMEFPADPWQHYARVNEWSWQHFVTEHTQWKKSSYFLPYSLLRDITPPLIQLKWFNIYYSGCCLLLCWQYYLFARAVGLSERVSFVFVLLNTLTFGNNIFSFYRYYGLSSSIFAQIGAVALTRLALEVAQNPQLSLRAFFRLQFTAYRLSLIAAVPALLALTAFNHIQGIGIAGLGILAVCVWRLIEWRRFSLMFLAGITVLASIAVFLWYPRHPLLNTVYQQNGWLTPWLGFNFFSPVSPSMTRAIDIFGCVGLVNLICGVILFWRNRAVAWLTCLNPVALTLPCIAIPIASVLAADRHLGLEEGYIITFNRFLFAAPPTLAVCVLVADIHRELSKSSAGALSHLSLCSGTITTGAILSCMAMIVVIPAGKPFLNRVFQAWTVTPSDLAMKHILGSPEMVTLSLDPRPGTSDQPYSPAFLKRRGVIATLGIGYALNATGMTNIRGARKWMTWPTVTPPSLTVPVLRENLQRAAATRINLTSAEFSPIPNLYTPYSPIGFLSKHWLPGEVALEHAGQENLFSPLPVENSNARTAQLWLEWFNPKGGEHIFARGAGDPMEPENIVDRGWLEQDTRSLFIQQGDWLTLRPVLRTPRGNGWRVEISIAGPIGIVSHKSFTAKPEPLGSDLWIFGDHRLRLDQAGDYTVDLKGTTVWPTQTYRTRYRFCVHPASTK